MVKRLFTGIRPFQLPSGGGGAEIPFLPDDYLPFFEKLSRGLFFVHRNRPFAGEFFAGFRQSFIPSSEGMAEFFSMLTPHFERDGTLGKCPYPEIFRYKFIESLTDEHHVFAIEMRFYDSTEVISALTASHPKQ
ncbi:hypothetical protein ACXR0O_14055 [Verrucomicrobiota bacterium sgz303538]